MRLDSKTELLTIYKKLDVFAERFRIMDLEPLRSMGIRRMLVDNYPVFYVVRDDRVIVTNVLCSGSDIVERLKIG